MGEQSDILKRDPWDVSAGEMRKGGGAQRNISELEQGKFFVFPPLYY